MKKRAARVAIADLTKELVLASLYNAATPRGLGFTHYDARPMDSTLAHHVINVRGGDLPHMLHKLHPESFGLPAPCHTLAFDYLFGRPLKFDLSPDEVDVESYDGIHGNGRARLVVDILRRTGDPADKRIMAMHFVSLRVEASREWGELPEDYRNKVLASNSGGHRGDSMDHVIASILFPPAN